MSRIFPSSTPEEPGGVKDLKKASKFVEEKLIGESNTNDSANLTTTPDSNPRLNSFSKIAALAGRNRSWSKTETEAERRERAGAILKMNGITNSTEGEEGTYMCQLHILIIRCSQFIVPCTSFLILYICIIMCI
jgi:hypothetical protein